MTGVILYERAGCHLCQEVGVQLDEMLGRDAYQRIDIDTDDDLVVRYGFRVPVLAVDGIDRLEGQIGPDELIALLGRR
jgi:hypothetical protein